MTPDELRKLAEEIWEAAREDYFNRFWNIFLLYVQITYYTYRYDWIKVMKKFLFSQKYRFDMGYQFLTLINFTLLVISVSDKLKLFLHIEKTVIFVVGMVGAALFSIWLFGFFLDKVIRYNQNYALEEARRNPKWQMQMDGINETVRILKSMEKK